MKRRIACLALAALLLLIMAGCGKAESGRENVEGEEKKIQIGLSFDSFVIERWQRDREIGRASCRERV